MSNLQYTVLSGDTLDGIASGINAATGVTYQQLEEANPDTPASGLQVGDIINVPSPSNLSQTVLKYTVMSGDSYYSIATNINACAGCTAQSIEEANPGLNPNSLQIGQVITIPAGGHVDPPGPPIDAKYIGYWCKTWDPGTAPAGTNLGMAFSGYTDVAQALADSAKVLGSLQGKKYISLGGGNEAGSWSATALSAINDAIAANAFSEYDGIAYDIEEGDSGLSSAFAQSFAAAKKAGFSVLVTVSHSAPYGISDAYDLMQGFFPDANIDILSPQLYTDGSEPNNDYATTAGVTWPMYAAAKAAVVPSTVLANDHYYDTAKAYFAKDGVTIEGAIGWNG